ncbi:hypothetical protein TNCV_936911 [Trichonephila clavipes]|nr:hypothetical protein TNCV_936911 [Trichonephila clavipes]
MRCFPGVHSCEKYRIQTSPVSACGINKDMFACVKSAVFPDFQVSSARIPECSCVVLYKFEDMNPIENVWNALGRRVVGRQPPPQTLQDLERALLEEWDRIPPTRD